jgi:hypothetical protein
LAKPRGRKPDAAAGRLPQPPAARVDYNQETPKFCLHFIQSGFDVGALPTAARQAAFAKTLQKLAASKWKDLIVAHYKGQGIEMIPARQIKSALPARFQDQDKVMVFRYDGKLPMAGVRVDDVYHVLWIEPEFNMLYDHG